MIRLRHRRQSWGGWGGRDHTRF